MNKTRDWKIWKAKVENQKLIRPFLRVNDLFTKGVAIRALFEKWLYLIVR